MLLRCIPVIVLASLLTACTSNQNPQEVREKTAQATAELKSDAKAVAQGVKEGWNRDKPLDINSATKDQIESLPGITGVDADKIISSRPYDAPVDLVNRGVLSKSKYDRISDRLTAKH